MGEYPIVNRDVSGRINPWVSHEDEPTPEEVEEEQRWLDEFNAIEAHGDTHHDTPEP